MEVGCLLLFQTLSSPLIRPPLRRHSWPVPSSPLLRASSSPPPIPSPPSAYPQGAYRGPKPRRDLVGDWVSNNDGFVRSLPIFVGGLSLLAVLLNRAFSGIAPEFLNDDGDEMRVLSSTAPSSTPFLHRRLFSRIESKLHTVSLGLSFPICSCWFLSLLRREITCAELWFSFVRE
ncbi:uncharacterized protein LOC120110671 [Phoenix dactylifera]|uniref:Uncharacterized protein LOC120110671 n=1 Tax=Phoenix dactylifera TaxID=42345 RepID=A0A8B9A8Y9_PHODC|nr:uncharacterized protein LOC120110671 [Phoenix dactylifera]